MIRGELCALPPNPLCLILDCVFSEAKQTFSRFVSSDCVFCVQLSTANHGTPFGFVVLMSIAFNEIQLLIWQLN